MIQSVHAHNDLDTLVPLFKCLDAVLDFGFLQRICELLWIDADDEFVCAD